MSANIWDGLLSEISFVKGKLDDIDRTPFGDVSELLDEMAKSAQRAERLAESLRAQAPKGELMDALEGGFDLLLAMIEGECPSLIEDDMPAIEAIDQVRRARTNATPTKD